MVQLSHEELRELISVCVGASGISKQLLGYKYLTSGIQIIVNADREWVGLIKVVYPGIAAEYNANVHMVARAMQSAIAKMWAKGDIARQKQYFHYCRSNSPMPPTNFEYMHTLADRVRMMLLDKSDEEEFFRIANDYYENKGMKSPFRARRF